MYSVTCQTKTCNNKSSQFCHFCHDIKCSSCRVTCATCRVTHCNTGTCQATKSKCKALQSNKKKSFGRRTSTASAAPSHSCQHCKKSLQKKPLHGLCTQCGEQAQSALHTVRPAQPQCLECNQLTDIRAEGLCHTCFHLKFVKQLQQPTASLNVVNTLPQPRELSTKKICHHCGKDATSVINMICVKCVASEKRAHKQSPVAQQPDSTLLTLRAAFARLKDAITSKPEYSTLDSLIMIPQEKDEANAYFKVLFSLEMFLCLHPVTENFNQLTEYFSGIYYECQQFVTANTPVAANLQKMLLLQNSLIKDLGLYRATIATLPNKPHPIVADKVRSLILATLMQSATVQDAQFRTNHITFVACSLMLSFAEAPQLSPGTVKLYEKLMAYVKSSYDSNLYNDLDLQPLSNLLTNSKNK